MIARRRFLQKREYESCDSEICRKGGSIPG